MIHHYPVRINTLMPMNVGNYSYFMQKVYHLMQLANALAEHPIQSETNSEEARFLKSRETRPLIFTTLIQAKRSMKPIERTAVRSISTSIVKSSWGM